MKETVPRRLSDVQAGSGSVLATVCASTSPQCATTHLTAPMVLTSLLSVVSLISATFVSLELIFCLSQSLDYFIEFVSLLASSNSIKILYHMTNRIKLLT